MLNSLSHQQMQTEPTSGCYTAYTPDWWKWGLTIPGSSGVQPTLGSDGAVSSQIKHVHIS